MATSGALSTSNEKIKYTITITQNSQNASANTSNVTVSVRFYRTNTGYETYGTGTVYCKINGTTYSAAVASSQKITNSGIVLFTKTLNISHNSDGTKTLNCSAWINHERVTSSEQSYNQTLTTIAVASTFTLSGTGNMGDVHTISITRKNSTYKHTIAVTFGGSTSTIASNVATSYSWTPALATYAAKIPNATNGTCFVTVTTLTSAGVAVGQKQLSFTLKIPDTVKPSISAFAISEAVDGIAAQFGAYVNGKSKIKWSTTAAGVYGSTINSYSVSIAGQNASSANGTTGVINTTAGTKTATVTVTDSRGRTASKTVNFTVYDYAAPQINFTVVRALSNGTEDDEGVYLKWGIVCTVSPVNNKNTAKYGLGWKLTSASSYTAIETDISANTYSVNKAMTLQSPTFSTDNTYDVRFSVTDFFGTVSKVVKLQSGSPVFDITADGSGMSFGMVSERNENGFRKPIGVYGGFKGINIKATAENQVDLNEIKQAGIYHCASTVNLLNKPTSSNATASLVVLEGGDAGQLEQNYRIISKDASLEYKRHYYQSAWGEWKRTSGSVLLWDGDEEETKGLWMIASQTTTLSEAVSKQPTGIVLVFSRYSDGAGVDEDFVSHFVPKGIVSLKGGKLHAFHLANAWHNYIGTKAVHIHDTKIVGHDLNKDAGTRSGITYDNTKWVLRYVYGV